MASPPRVIWAATAALALAATLAFALGKDSWDRSVTEPTADAAYYYAYLPSLVLDRDLDFTNEYRVTHNWYRLGSAPTGRPSNVFGIGPAIFELPVFLVGHGLARLTGARSDGFSSWETALAMWTGIPFTLGAMLLAWRLARRRVDSSAAGYLGALAAAVAGPLLYYAIRQPGYAHPCAALFATLLVERWDASYDAPRTLRTWIVLGAAAGAAMLARPQLALWALLLPVAALDDLRRHSASAADRSSDRPARSHGGRLVARWAAGALAALVVFAPQLIAWKILYGAWYVVPQGPGFMRWDAPAWSETLMSSRNGLLPWAPLYAPMLLGVVLLARRSMRLPLALLLGLFGQALANGAAWDWWAGGSFGGRRFDSCYPVFAVGAAALIASGARILRRPIGLYRVRDHIARVAVGAGLVAAILVALATIELALRTSVISARITGGEPASAIWRRSIGGVRGELAAWLSSASNAPARAWFAWRYDRPLTDYDRLIGVHVLGETYPGLNSYPDRRSDSIAAPGKLAAPSRRILVGINRRGTISLRIPVETTGRVTAIWNDAVTIAYDVAGRGTVELPAVPPRRGLNTLEIAAPIGAAIGTIELTASD